MKSKDALEKIKNIGLLHLAYYDDDDSIDSYEEYDGTIEENYPDAIKTIEKELKAFEIIKEKSVIPAYIVNTKNVEEYNKLLKEITFRKDWLERILTQEEFDLLKEVLL